MNFEWGYVSGGVFAVVVIMLFLAPFFWWLYDTDRFMEASGNGEYLFLAISVIQFARTTLDHRWWWALFWGGATLLSVVRLRTRHRSR